MQEETLTFEEIEELDRRYTEGEFITRDEMMKKFWFSEK